MVHQQDSTMFHIPPIIGGYQVGELVGTGTFSVVHKGTHIETGTQVCEHM